jgi:hypothetical protein
MRKREPWAAATCSEGENGPAGVSPRPKARPLSREHRVRREILSHRERLIEERVRTLSRGGRYQGFNAMGTGTDDRAERRRRRALRQRLLVAATALASQITSLGGRDRCRGPLLAPGAVKQKRPLPSTRSTRSRCLFKLAERVRKRTQALRAGCANGGHTPTVRERVKSTRSRPSRSTQ